VVDEVERFLADSQSPVEKALRSIKYFARSFLPEKVTFDTDIMAQKLGIDEVRFAGLFQKTHYEDGVLTLTRGLYNKLEDMFQMDASGANQVSDDVLQAVFASIKTGNDDIMIRYRDYMKEMDRYLADKGIEPGDREQAALSPLIWFDLVFPGSIDLDKEQMDTLMGSTLWLREDTKGYYKLQKSVNLAKDLNMEFLGQKQIDTPEDTGYMGAGDEQAGLTGVRPAIRQLIGAIQKLGSRIANIPFTIAELPADTLRSRRLDTLAAAAFMGGGRMSLLDLVMRGMGVAGGGRYATDEIVVPDLRKLINVLTST
ncbi:hypothetical protein ACFLTD_04640, partial [Elusimicrobiota bacterium]